MIDTIGGSFGVRGPRRWIRARIVGMCLTALTTRLGGCRNILRICQLNPFYDAIVWQAAGTMASTNQLTGSRDMIALNISPQRQGVGPRAPRK
jgi:hypothetical protein